MKKTLILSIALMCLIFTSCKKEENTTNANSNNTYMYDFVIDNKNYTWSGTYKADSPAAIFITQGENQITYSTTISITKSASTSDEFGVVVFTDIHSPGVVTCDLNSGAKNAIALMLDGKQYASYLGNCKLEITKHDIVNKVIKGTIKGEVGWFDVNGNIFTKSIVGSFNLPLINGNQ
jgi:hypothetical protein